MKWDILRYFIQSGKEVPGKTRLGRAGGSKLEVSFTGFFKSAHKVALTAT